MEGFLYVILSDCEVERESEWGEKKYIKNYFVEVKELWILF